MRVALQVGRSEALNDHHWHGVDQVIRLSLAGGTLIRPGTDGIFTIAACNHRAADIELSMPDFYCCVENFFRRRLRG